MRGTIAAIRFVAVAVYLPLCHGYGPASKLSFTQQPSGALAAANFTTQPVVAVQDTQGNVVITDSTTAVVMSVRSGPGVLSGATNKTVSSGVATFTDLQLDAIGAHMLMATASIGGGSETANSSSFTVTGPASNLSFAYLPSESIMAVTGFSTGVLVQDAQGNVVTTDSTTTVMMSVHGGAATLSGTATQTAVSGMATFAGLQLDAIGAHVLRATASIGGSLQTVDSVSFTVRAACASRKFLRIGGGGKCSYMLVSDHLMYNCDMDECVVYIRALEPNCGATTSSSRIMSRKAKNHILAHTPPMQDIMGTILSYGDGEVWPESGVADFE